jgi:putative intracellular protease/amidase
MKFCRRGFLYGLGAFSAVCSVAPESVLAQALQQRLPPVDLGDQGVLYRFMFDVGDRLISCIAASLPRRSFTARIVEQHDRSTALTAVQDVGKTIGATVAVNGGRFNGAFAPDGLLVVNGKTIGEKRADGVGYLTIDTDGNASVTDAPKLHLAQYAVQGNPLIVEPGGKMGVAREDGQRFRRTVVAQSGDVILAIATSPASLFELGYLLIERPDIFFMNHIDAALNLSGAATTGFYANVPNGEPVIVPAYWPNRDVVTFSARAFRG